MSVGEASGEGYRPKKNLPFRPISPADFPGEVQVQTHTRCNGRCLMCPYGKTSAVVSHGVMRRELFERIVDECVGRPVKEFKPFLMNEPLLDRRLPGLIGYARERLPETAIGFSTNGQLLEGRLADELLDSGLDELWVNLGGHTQATYERVMPGLSLERARRNVLRFAGKSAARGGPVRVIISVVEMKPALAEIEAMREYWGDHGLTVATTPLNNRGGHVDRDGLRVLGEVDHYRVCDRPFHKICVTFNGEVILCSSDWARETILGDVAADGVHGVWHGAAATEVRRKLEAHDPNRPSLCRRCDYVAIYA